MTPLAGIARFLRYAGRQITFRAAVISGASVAVAALASIIARTIPYEFTGDIGQNAVGTILEIIASSMLAVTTFSLTAMVSAVHRTGRRHAMVFMCIGVGKGIALMLDRV